MIAISNTDKKVENTPRSEVFVTKLETYFSIAIKLKSKLRNIIAKTYAD